MNCLKQLSDSHSDNYSNNKTTEKSFPNHTNLNILDFDISDINQYNELDKLYQSNQYSKLIHTAANISLFRN